MTIVEQASVANAKNTRRRRLNPDQEREVARLYGEGTSTADIRERFGIGDSTLYRVVQKLGVPLRGRSATSTSSPPPTPKTRVGRRRRAAGSASVKGPALAPRRLAQSRSDGGRGRYQITFKAERVFTAQGILEALRQAESAGATEITAVTRLD